MAPVLSTPQKTTMPKATPQKRTRGGQPPLAVTDWVTVHLNKRRMTDRMLAKTPAVISSINIESGTANLLYPNVLSEFMSRRAPDGRILFAIKTYPLANIRRWEDSRTELDNVMRRALLQFVEQRGTAVRNSEMLQVTSAAAPEVVDTAAATETIQRDLAEHVAGTEVDDSQPSTPMRAKSRDGNVASEDEGSPPQVNASQATQTASAPTQVTTTGGGSLLSFTAKLAKLLGGASASLPKSAVKESLALEFPSWDAYLVQLDAMNKIFVAEEAVFRL